MEVEAEEEKEKEKEKEKERDVRYSRTDEPGGKMKEERGKRRINALPESKAKWATDLRRKTICQ